MTELGIPIEQPGPGPQEDGGERDGRRSLGPSDRESRETTEIEDLLERMRNGDREAAAEFMSRYGTRIRRRIHGKLSPAMRRLFDSLEIMSTLGRRLDLHVRAGRLQAATGTDLWRLVFLMSDHAVVDKARVFQRLQRLEDDDSAFAHEISRRRRHAERRRRDGVELEIDRAMNMLDDALDREILANWLAGSSLHEIAELIDRTPAAVRKRWQKIRAVLRERVLRESTGGDPVALDSS